MSFNLKITVIVDDRAVEELIGVHGLSILVEYKDYYILFDTGSSPQILEDNANRLGIDLELIDAVVLSHIHTPHIGGLPYIGWLSPFIRVYAPYGSLESMYGIIRQTGLKPVEVDSWIRIHENIYVSKPLHGPPWEHFLIIDHGKNLTIFSGCMHPGLKTLINEITEYFGHRKIYALIGGFHLSNAPDKVISNIVELIKELNPKYIIPLHCSGEVFREKIKLEIPHVYRDIKAGETITL